MPGGEKSDAIIEHRDSEGRVVSKDAAVLTFNGLAKAAGGVIVMLFGALLVGGFGFYVATVQQNAGEEVERRYEAEGDARLSRAIEENSAALKDLTKTIEKLPTAKEVEARAARATDEAVAKSASYTDSKIAVTQQDMTRMATDVTWIRQKQDDQGREIKEGFKGIEKKLSEMKDQ